MHGSQLPPPATPRPTHSFGITLWGALLIFSSLIHIHKLIVDIEWYTSTYSYWPAGLIVLRYSFSWVQRILGTLVGAGILMRNNLARLTGMGIGWFTMAVLCWKHPYHAFKIHAQYLDKRYAYFFSSLGVPHLSFESLALAATIAQWICDITFWSFFIFFFTRPSVKKQFHP